MSDIEVRVPDPVVEEPTSTDTWEDPAPASNSATDETVEDAKAPRYRATKVEMEGREKAALRLLQQAPTTINKLATETNLPYPKAATLVQRLVSEGRVTAIGQESNRTLYRLDPKVAVKPVRQLPTHSFTNFLDHFHIGQQLKVVGFHVTEDGQTIDVRGDDDKIIKMTTAG